MNHTRTRRVRRVALAGLAAAATLAQAQTFGTGTTHSEWVPVISSTPIVERVTQPREECRTDRVTRYESRRVGGISLGAFDTTTSVVVPVTRDVQRCETITEATDVVQGYEVRYQYQGREYVTRTAADPGSRIRVDVSVLPGAP